MITQNELICLIFYRLLPITSAAMISRFKGLTVRKFSLQNIMDKVSTVPSSVQWETLLLVVYLLYFSL